MLIYACDVYRTLRIDWLRGTVLVGKAISSIDDRREASLKRETRCRVLVMSSWPDDGAFSYEMEESK